MARSSSNGHAPMRRNGPYAPLSAHYSRDDAFFRLDADENDLAELLYLRSLAYCAGDTRLDGYISDLAIQRGAVLLRRKQDRVIRAAEALVDVGLFVREGSGYRIRSWSKWNRTNAEIEGKRESERLRKSGHQAPDDEPPPPEDRDGPPADSGVSPNGFHEDSARSPDGIPMESASVPAGIASRGYAPASNATHSNAPQRSSPQRIAAAAATPPGGQQPPPPPPDLPPDLADLASRLATDGIAVAWDPDPDGLVSIGAAVARCGVPALVKQAKSRYQANDPAFSVRAFVAGWAALPAPATKLTLVADPCPDGYDHPSKCPFCRNAQAAS